MPELTAVETEYGPLAQLPLAEDLTGLAEIIAQKKALAKRLQATPTPGIADYGNKVMVLPGWGEVASHAVNRVRGANLQDEADQMAVELQRRLAAGEQSFLKSLPTDRALNYRDIAPGLSYPNLRSTIGKAFETITAEPFEQQKAERAAEAQGRTFAQQTGLQTQRDAAALSRAQASADAAAARQQAAIDAADRRQQQSISAADARAQRREDIAEAKANAPKPLSAAAQKQQSSLMNLESGLNAYNAALASYDPRGTDALSAKRRAALGTAATDMRMRLKEAYELGAITGPDMEIINKAITDPTDIGGSLKGLIFGREPFQAQTSEMRGVLNRMKSNFENQYGRSIPPAATTPAVSTATSQSPEATKTINGKTYFKRGGQWYEQ